MDKFEKLIKILKEFNLNKAIEKIIKSNQKEILNLIPKEQIYKGIKGDGGAIVPPYTPAYRSYKINKRLYLQSQLEAVDRLDSRDILMLTYVTHANRCDQK